MGYTLASISLLFTQDKFPVNSFLVKLKKLESYELIYQLKSLYLRVQVRIFNARPGPSAGL